MKSEAEEEMTYIYPYRGVVCSERECSSSPIARDKDTKLDYCLSHLVERVSLEERHRIAREGNESEIDILTVALHETYHCLENATGIIEKVAQRLPNCGEMPTDITIDRQRLLDEK